MAPRDPLERHRSSPVELQALNAMERTGSAFLAWRDAEEALQLQPLDPAAGRVTIGRAPRSTIALTWDDRVSSVHAEVQPLDDEWVVVDDGLSLNGTFIGGERVGSRRRLRDEDRILVGSTVLAFKGAVGHRSTLLGGQIVERGDLSANELAVLRSLCAPLVLGRSQEPAVNAAIAGEVHLTEDGVKRCLTRLFRMFEVDEDPKRRRLAQRAIATGVVRSSDYRA